MKPTIGRVVLYTTTAQDQKVISEHPHNTPQEVSPAIIVAVADGTINLKVLIDGCGDLYKKEVAQGDEPGQWNWPVIESPTLFAENVNFDFADDADLALSNSFKIANTLLDAIKRTEAAGQTTRGDDPGAPGVEGEPGIPHQPESLTPLVVLDHETGKHKAAAKPKPVKKPTEPVVVVTDNPLA